MGHAADEKRSLISLRELSDRKGKSSWSNLIQEVKLTLSFKGNLAEEDSARLLMCLGQSSDSQFVDKIFATAVLASVADQQEHGRSESMLRPVSALLRMKKGKGGNVEITKHTPLKKNFKENCEKLLKVPQGKNEVLHADNFQTFVKKLSTIRTCMFEAAKVIQASSTKTMFPGCGTSPAETLQHMASDFDKLRILLKGLGGPETQNRSHKESALTGSNICFCCAGKLALIKAPTFESKKRRPLPASNKSNRKKPRIHRSRKKPQGNGSEQDEDPMDDEEACFASIGPEPENSDKEQEATNNTGDANRNGLPVTPIRRLKLLRSLPMIHIETFRDSQGRPCKGPDGDFAKFPHDCKEGESLRKVTCCPTASSHFHSFSGADWKHHSVVEEARSLEHQKKVFEHLDKTSFHRYTTQDLLKRIRHNNEFLFFSDHREP